MNRNSIPTLVGVFSSLFVIWLLHGFLVVDDCVEQGGTFDYAISKCVLEDGLVYESSIATLVIVLYFIIGFFVSFFVSTLIRKIFKSKQSDIPNKPL
jgi:hypothetical protein